MYRRDSKGVHSLGSESYLDVALCLGLAGQQFANSPEEVEPYTRRGRMSLAWRAGVWGEVKSDCLGSNHDSAVDLWTWCS